MRLDLPWLPVAYNVRTQTKARKLPVDPFQLSQTGNGLSNPRNISQQTKTRIRSKSSSSSSSLSVSPIDISGAASLLSIKYDFIRKAAGSSVPQILSDASYVVMDVPTFFPHMKISKLRLRYAQVLGRLMIIGITLLPNHIHQVHYEEMAVQLFLLSISMKPIIRSMQLFQCITASSSGSVCTEECVLELEELEDALAVNNNKSRTSS